MEGFPFLDLMKSNPNAIWANLIDVFYRPLIDQIIFDDL